MASHGHWRSGAGWRHTTSHLASFATSARSEPSDVSMITNLRTCARATVQRSAAQCSAAQRSAAQRSAAQRSAAQRSAVQCVCT
jgi:hypothetical protein